MGYPVVAVGVDGGQSQGGEDRAPNQSRHVTAAAGRNFEGQSFTDGPETRQAALLYSPWLRYAGTMAADFRDVDPAELRLPSSRLSGADPYKLQRQIARHGASITGMPPLFAYAGPMEHWNW